MSGSVIGGMYGSHYREQTQAEGVSATDLVKRALDEYLQQTHDEDHNEAHNNEEATATIAALTAQLSVKDAQISRLMDVLSQAQEMTRAAQMLEGAYVARALAGDATRDVADKGARPRSGLLRRLHNWLRG